MNWLDAGIAVFVLAALVRGTEVGFVRQFFSTVGLFGGLFLGAWAGGKLSHFAHTNDDRALLALATTVAIGLSCMTIGEYLGWRAKFRIHETHLADKTDRVLGSALAVVSLLAAVWLAAAVFRNLPAGLWQREIRTSRIISVLGQRLPSAPNALTELGRLIDPNGFPQVFAGLEPAPGAATIPNIGDLTAAVRQDASSVVKIEGRGCGGIVEGSGFVAATGEVITNAHVVAGVAQPYVQDSLGNHVATVIFFDPDFDLTILRASGLAGKPLTLDTQTAAANTPAAIVGYPGGGNFTAKPAAIVQQFTATGRNIYNQGHTERQVYSIKGDVEQGNSGGPLIAQDGSVIGIVFAKSTSYSQVGYALSAQHVAEELTQNGKNTTPVTTGTCAE